MPQTDQEALQSILTEIANMDKIMSGKSAVDLTEDLTLERAVSMTLGLIGERVNKVSQELRETHPEIEWRKISGLRNRIVHNYEDLDFDIIYDTVVRKLPELKEQLQKVLIAHKKALLLKKKPSNNLLPKRRVTKGNGRNLKP